MSKRNGRRKDKKKILTTINLVDKRYKKEKDPEKKEKLLAQRKQLLSKIR
tara:strand:- start:85 stop:234 length:150 start_codon:yes stop_codon:yes gene_type:complete